MDDVLNDALSNLVYDNYERGHKGYKSRQADVALIRAALAAQPAASVEPVVTAAMVRAAADELGKQTHPWTACVRDALRAALAAQPAASAEPIAWESTTPAFIKYITDSKYRKFSLAARQWYRPYRCSRCAAQPAQPAESAEPSDEELARLWRQVSGRETLRPDSVAMTFARALLSRYGRPAGDADEYQAMLAVMEQIDPATFPGLTTAQRCALGRFAKPVAAQKADDAHDNRQETEFEVWQNEMLVAGASGPRKEALREAMNYAEQYAEDGLVEVFEVKRALIAAIAQQRKGE